MRAFVFGELCEDILMHDPASVAVMGQKTWAKDILLTAGGSISYTGAALKALGAETALCSVLGTDDCGQRILKKLEKHRIDTSQITFLEGAETTRSMIVCSGGKKDFIGCSPMLPLKVPAWEQIRDYDLFYIAGYTLYPELWTEEMIGLCMKARENGICVAMDSQLLPVSGCNLAELSGLARILPAVDIFFTAGKEAKPLFGTDDPDDCYAAMQKMGFRGQLILKRGKDGCWVVDPDGKETVGACLVEAYDTVGSGDVFGGSYCWAHCQGMDKHRCAEFAAAATALSIRKYSVDKHFPSAAETEKMLHYNYHS